MRYSTNWKYWDAVLDLRTCLICRRLRGKIYAIDEEPEPKPPIHFYCRCKLAILECILPGTATKKGVKGADLYLVKYKKLPDYYISCEQAKKEGWKPEKGNLALKCPGKMIFGGIYHNNNGHLPSAPNRVWYEADINYESGYRGTDRILFSNDGLIFVTYDHYKTFIEIEQGELI